MRVAVCQLDLSDDADMEVRAAHNRAGCEAGIRRAAASGADLIVLPERAFGGNVFASKRDALQLAEPLTGGPVLAEWCQLSESLGVLIAGSFLEVDDDENVYNSCALIEDGEIKAVHRKAHTFEIEDGVFTPGNAVPPVVDTRCGSIGLLVCYDAEFPEYFRMPCLAGADIVVVPVAWADVEPAPSGERRMDVVRLQAAAGANHVFVAVANWGGTHGHDRWAGVLGCDGYPIVGPTSSGDPEILFADIEPAIARDKYISGRNHVHGDMRNDLYGRARENQI